MRWTVGVAPGRSADTSPISFAGRVTVRRPPVAVPGRESADPIGDDVPAVDSVVGGASRSGADGVDARPPMSDPAVPGSPTPLVGGVPVDIAVGADRGSAWSLPAPSVSGRCESDGSSAAAGGPDVSTPVGVPPVAGLRVSSCVAPLVPGAGPPSSGSGVEAERVVPSDGSWVGGVSTRSPGVDGPGVALGPEPDGGSGVVGVGAVVSGTDGVVAGPTSLAGADPDSPAPGVSLPDEPDGSGDGLVVEGAGPVGGEAGDAVSGSGSTDALFGSRWTVSVCARLPASGAPADGGVGPLAACGDDVGIAPVVVGSATVVAIPPVDRRVTSRFDSVPVVADAVVAPPIGSSATRCVTLPFRGVSVLAGCRGRRRLAGASTAVDRGDRSRTESVVDEVGRRCVSAGSRPTALAPADGSLTPAGASDSVDWRSGADDGLVVSSIPDRPPPERGWSVGSVSDVDAAPVRCASDPVTVRSGVSRVERLAVGPRPTVRDWTASVESEADSAAGRAGVRDTSGRTVVGGSAAVPVGRSDVGGRALPSTSGPWLSGTSLPSSSGAGRLFTSDGTSVVRAGLPARNPVSGPARVPTPVGESSDAPWAAGGSRRSRVGPTATVGVAWLASPLSRVGVPDWRLSGGVVPVRSGVATAGPLGRADAVSVGGESDGAVAEAGVVSGGTEPDAAAGTSRAGSVSELSPDTDRLASDVGSLRPAGVAVSGGGLALPGSDAIERAVGCRSGSRSPTVSEGDPGAVCPASPAAGGRWSTGAMVDASGPVPLPGDRSSADAESRWTVSVGVVPTPGVFRSGVVGVSGDGGVVDAGPHLVSGPAPLPASGSRTVGERPPDPNPSDVIDGGWIPCVVEIVVRGGSAAVPPLPGAVVASRSSGVDRPTVASVGPVSRPRVVTGPGASVSAASPVGNGSDDGCPAALSPPRTVGATTVAALSAVVVDTDGPAGPDPPVSCPLRLVCRPLTPAASAFSVATAASDRERSTRTSPAATGPGGVSMSGDRLLSGVSFAGVVAERPPSTARVGGAAGSVRSVGGVAGASDSSASGRRVSGAVGVRPETPAPAPGDSPRSSTDAGEDRPSPDRSRVVYERGAAADRCDGGDASGSPDSAVVGTVASVGVDGRHRPMPLALVADGCSSVAGGSVAVPVATSEPSTGVIASRRGGARAGAVGSDDSGSARSESVWRLAPSRGPWVCPTPPAAGSAPAPDSTERVTSGATLRRSGGSAAIDCPSACPLSRCSAGGSGGPAPVTAVVVSVGVFRATELWMLLAGTVVRSGGDEVGGSDSGSLSVTDPAATLGTVSRSGSPELGLDCRSDSGAVPATFSGRSGFARLPSSGVVVADLVGSADVSPAFSVRSAPLSAEYASRGVRAVRCVARGVWTGSTPMPSTGVVWSDWPRPGRLVRWLWAVDSPSLPSGWSGVCCPLSVSAAGLNTGDRGSGGNDSTVGVTDFGGRGVVTVTVSCRCSSLASRPARAGSVPAAPWPDPVQPSAWRGSAVSVCSSYSSCSVTA